MTSPDTFTAREYLYISIDLGNRPALSALADQQTYLLDLYRYSFMATFGLFYHPSDLGSRQRPNRIYRRGETLVGRIAREGFTASPDIARTRLASPWVTILAAQSLPYFGGAAAAYGVLLSLTELLRLRRDLDTRDNELTHGMRDSARVWGRENQRLLDEHKEMTRRSGILPQIDDDLSASSGNDLSYSPTSERALTRLGPVREIEIINEADRRFAL